MLARREPLSSIGDTFRIRMVPAVSRVSRAVHRQEVTSWLWGVRLVQGQLFNSDHGRPFPTHVSRRLLFRNLRAFLVVKMLTAGCVYRQISLQQTAYAPIWEMDGHFLH